jgi:exopolyphosphatase / guanosine-5'-triphosphate,3'-diphosphate pyrophosphatase
MKHPMTGVAVIDLGSNSTRLLAVDESGNDLARRMIVTKLGEGLNATGRLSSAAIERTVAAVRTYKAEIDGFGITTIDATATAAARIAENRDELFDALESVLGIRPRLLSGVEEAHVGWRGATSWATARTTPFGEPAYDVMIDIGGGSTEFAVGQPGNDPIGAWSINVGCVRLTEEFFKLDPPGPVALSSAITVVRSHLDDVAREIPLMKQADRLIGVAGSITTVAAIELGMSTYDRERIHQFALTRAAAEDVFRTVATEASADRAANPGLSKDRVGTIVAGALILVAIMRHFDFDSCIISEADNLDGAVQLLQSRQRD